MRGCFYAQVRAASTWFSPTRGAVSFLEKSWFELCGRVLARHSGLRWTCFHPELLDESVPNAPICAELDRRMSRLNLSPHTHRTTQAAAVILPQEDGLYVESA